MRPAFWAALAAVAAALPPGAGAAEDDRRERPRVRWQAAGEDSTLDPRLARLLAVLDGATEEALARLARTFDLAPGERPIRWIVDVAAVPAAGPTPPPYFDGGRTAWAGDTVEVRVPARKYLARPVAARAVAAHEAFHAVVASHLGPRRGEALPRWFREGAAVWFAGEGERCVDDAITGSLLAGRPSGAFLEERAEDAVSPHAQGYLAVTWIEKRAGAGALQDLIGRAVRGESFAAAFAARLGGSPAALAGEALRFARAEVRRRIDEEVEKTFAESLRLRAAGKSLAARGIWLSLLERDPRGPLAVTLHYFLARALLADRAGAAGLAESRAHLEEVLDRPDALWRPEALVLLGERLASEGDTARAADLWREVLEAFGEDDLPARRARVLLDALPATRTAH